MTKMYLLLKYSCFLFYLSAGVNHFINPDFYFGLIPNYLPYPYGINMLSGLLEMILSLLILSPKYLKIGAWGIVTLLIFFIPSHIYFIRIGSCVPNGLCLDPWIGWFRLIIVHPLLIFWAWNVGKLSFRFVQ